MTKEFKRQTTYELSSPFEFGTTGNVAKTLELYAPTVLHLKLTTNIRSYIKQAQKDATPDIADLYKGMSQEEILQFQETMTELAKSNANDEDEVAQLYETLSLSKYYAKACEEFRALLISAGICKINGNIDLKNGAFVNMLEADFAMVMEQYLSDFFMQ